MRDLKRPANYSDSLGCSAGVPTGAFLMIRPALRTAPLQKMVPLEFASSSQDVNFCSLGARSPPWRRREAPLWFRVR